MQIDRKSAAIFYLCWIQTSLGPILKPHPFKQLFSTSKVTTMLLNCFALEHSIFKTKQLSRVVVTLGGNFTSTESRIYKGRIDGDSYYTM